MKVRLTAEQLRDELWDKAEALGFARMGVAKAEQLGPEGERLSAWLAAGRHASMGWMQTTEDVRKDVNHPGMLATAKSVVVLAAPYPREQTRFGLSPGTIAKYARGRDYHNVIHKRLRKITRFLREKEVVARAAVDSMPVFERAWAERAGLGFIGKNCCLIVPGIGSHVFLAALVVDADLPVDAPMKEKCGDCRRCLDACPTKAFVQPRELDARRCISYLTIEHAGPIDEELLDGIGDRIFGCDVCQDVCPFNHTKQPLPEPTPFLAQSRWADMEAADLLTFEEEAFREYSEGSPLRRAGAAKMARNAAIVLGNTRDRRYLPVLETARDTHADPHVREAASWATKKIDR